MSRRAASSRLYAVILAGGRGTRFWPRSRRRAPKQLLPFFSERSLIQQTAARLAPLIPPERVWVVTNTALRKKIAKQLPEVPAKQIIAEPEGKNTAPAIALAAKLLLANDPDAVMGVFPSDHLVSREKEFLRTLGAAARAADKGSLVVFGIVPRWAETGFGYIEFPAGTSPGGRRPTPVVGFREKPKRRTAERFVAAGNFYWNSGMFMWRARTILDEIERCRPRLSAAFRGLAPLGSRRFRRSLAKAYAGAEDISIDYAVLEKSDRIVGLPCADFGWNDVGSWEAVYSLAPKDAQGNAARGPVELLAASGNYVDAPGKLVALAGVRDLIVVDTPDALLICRRKDAQKVSALVKALEISGWDELL